MKKRITRAVLLSIAVLALGLLALHIAGDTCVAFFCYQCDLDSTPNTCMTVYTSFTHCRCELEAGGCLGGGTCIYYWDVGFPHV